MNPAEASLEADLGRRYRSVRVSSETRAPVSVSDSEGSRDSLLAAARLPHELTSSAHSPYRPHPVLMGRTHCRRTTLAG